MPKIYSSTNRIRFTDIPEKYAVPRQYRGKQSDVHSAIVAYVFENFRNTKKYKQQVVDALNYLTYCIMQNNLPPFEWVSTDPLTTMPDDIDPDEIESGLGDLFLTEDAIEWDVSAISYDEPEVVEQIESKPEVKATSTPKPAITQQPATNRFSNIKTKPQVTHSSNTSAETPKEDLYIQPPKYPRFDVSKVWLSQIDGGDKLIIYTTLPEVPTKQNEISVTTDVETMTDSELYNLYPKQVIHTRSPKMYEQYNNLDYDEDLGVIIPIEGFTKEEVVENIICYPHLYKLKKIDSDGRLSNFYATIEIDGELKPVSEVWDELPESKVMPRDSEFVKEYVVRRYLLEEQHGIEHKFKLFGTLDPFLTLFMPPSLYAKRGYNDPLRLARECVRSRVRYKQSRNPILRRLNHA